jgi:hypothetical protein
MHVHIQINSEYLNRGNQTNKGKECLYITTGKTVFSDDYFFVFFPGQIQRQRKGEVL